MATGSQVGKFNPPPALQTPEGTPWGDIEGIAQTMLSASQQLAAAAASLAALVPPAAPGAPAPAITNVLQVMDADDYGIADSGDNTSLTQNSKNWETNIWPGAVLIAKINNRIYFSHISANVPQTITFDALPTGVKVLPGTPYAIKFLPIPATSTILTLDVPWSSYMPQASLTTVAGDILLPSLTIKNIPTGATIIMALMFLKYRTTENTNASVNSVSGAQNIQAQMAVGGSWITGIGLLGGEFNVPAATRESGDVMMGTNDISAQLAANGAVMNFKWTAAVAAQNNLNFNDIQIGLRIWYAL